MQILIQPEYVTARRVIQQSPLSDAPPVPAGRRGSLDDEADGFFLVDFGGPYGVVLCDPSEVR
jgi:hypothetical protein